MSRSCDIAGATRKPCPDITAHGGERLQLRAIFDALGHDRRAEMVLMKTLPKVATEMAMHVLAFNVTRVMNTIGIKPLLAAIQA
jgi:hypothetical protein